ncbi:MAG: RluA family pseudouridine synthase [Odoribacter sp.]
MKSSTPVSHSSKNKRFNAEKPNTLLNFLFESLNNESKTTVKSLLTHKQISVNGHLVTQFDLPLKPGDEIDVFFDKSAIPFSHPLLNILYEDQSLIVINKMSGLLSMSSERDKEKTAYRILSDHVKKTTPHSCVFILHRLDRDTSGVMMFAKSQEVQEILQKNWDQMILERKYVAVVEGQLEKEFGQIKSYVAENSAYIVHKATAETGKLAITNYKVLKVGQGCSLVELELETGRKNQIRVHLQELGHPVVGDKKYGATSNPIHRLALHAFKLRFIHPLTREEMNFELPIPNRFKLLLKH